MHVNSGANNNNTKADDDNSIGTFERRRRRLLRARRAIGVRSKVFAGPWRDNLSGHSDWQPLSARRFGALIRTRVRIRTRIRILVYRSGSNGGDAKCKQRRPRQQQCYRPLLHWRRVRMGLTLSGRMSETNARAEWSSERIVSKPESVRIRAERQFGRSSRLWFARQNRSDR